jgi:hypothetical protein
VDLWRSKDEEIELSLTTKDVQYLLQGVPKLLLVEEWLPLMTSSTIV